MCVPIDGQAVVVRHPFWNLLDAIPTLDDSTVV